MAMTIENGVDFGRDGGSADNVDTVLLWQLV
jgi:hypothetical protein